MSRKKPEKPLDRAEASGAVESFKKRATRVPELTAVGDPTKRPQKARTSLPNLYAYIDEAGDEGFPKLSPYTDTTAYRDRSTASDGPSPFFMICGALVEDTQRTTLQKAVRALSKAVFPTAIDKEVHWRKLDWEKKQFIAEEVAKLEFSWVAVVARKPMLPKIYPPPLLYSWCTRLLLERLALNADRRGADLIPVFSNRARTNYADLQRYVNTQVLAYGTSSRLKPIRQQQPNKERLLQLVDVCAGSLHNALEVNAFGKLQTIFFRETGKRLIRINGRLWGHGIKFFPDVKGTDYGLATKWIEAVRNKEMGRSRGGGSR